MKSLLITIMLLQSCSAYAQDRSDRVTDVDSHRFRQLMDSLDGEVIVDLRTPEELKQGKIPGAIVIDYFGAGFEPAIKALDPNKTYLIYCAGGGRSGETATMMDTLGFKRVYNLGEGFNGWRKKKQRIQSTNDSNDE